MDTYLAGSRPSQPGNPDYFTGTVRLDPVIATPDPARLQAAVVTFEPGARTAWHTHPLGQTIHILSGVCLVQTDGGEVQEFHPGDTVYFAPDEKHWHGASPSVGMSHLAMQEALDGVPVVWLEQVTDADYAKPPVG